MWFEIIAATIIVGSWVYHRWIEDHPSAPKPPSLTLPRVDEGTPLPLIYGTVRVRTPVLIWSGNHFQPGETHDTIGHTGTIVMNHYSFDALFVLGIPFFGGQTVFNAAWAGDTPLVLLQDVEAQPNSFAFSIPQITSPVPPALDQRMIVNGVFYPGSATQDVTDGANCRDPASSGLFFDSIGYDNVTQSTSYRAALLENSDDITLVPGHRNIAVAYMHIGLGASPSVPAFSFQLKSLSTGTSSDLGNSMADDADPAAVIYDILTAPWKLGLSPSLIDIPSFQAASATLFSESHGYSRYIDQSQDADSIIADILKQIDGLIYQEPTTGKLVLKLFRADYGSPPFALIDNLNPDNARPAGSSWYTIQGWGELPNQVQLTWTDRANNYADGVAIAQDEGAINTQGSRIRSVSLRMIGCCIGTLAQKLASRELAAVSRPAVKATMIVDRRFYTKRPGDVVTLTWPQLGITTMPMRIVRVDLGQLHAGDITLDLYRDIYDVSLGAFPVA
jgi:putative tail protein